MRCRNKFGITILLALLILPVTASAEIYRWTDEEGVAHFTDDPSGVPEKYWEQEKVRKEEVRPSPPEEAAPAQPSPPPPAPEGEKGELYGDYPLDWWADKFKELKKDITDNEARLAQGKNSVSTFESGRRLGQVYTREQISAYEGYKAEIPALEEKIKRLRDELEELRRKARVYGVPREIRE